MNFATNQEVYLEIEKYYKRMCNCSSTAGRKNNYEQIRLIISKYPDMKKYWEIRNAVYYVDRVYCKCPLEFLTLKKYKSPKDEILVKEYAYIALLDKDTIKVGKTNNLNRRMYQLNNDYASVQLLASFEFNNTEDAFLMEVLLHKYYKAKYPKAEFLPQDRFKGAGLNEKDLENMSQMVNKIKNMEWFN